jgi:glutathione S-transferase
MADIFLVPMAYNALRFDYDLSTLHPKVMAVYEACNTLPAFQEARPEAQPDAVPATH